MSFRKKEEEKISFLCSYAEIRSENKRPDVKEITTDTECSETPLCSDLP